MKNKHCSYSLGEETLQFRSRIDLKCVRSQSSPETSPGSKINPESQSLLGSSPSHGRWRFQPKDRWLACEQGMGSCLALSWVTWRDLTSFPRLQCPEMVAHLLKGTDSSQVLPPPGSPSWPPSLNVVTLLCALAPTFIIALTVCLSSQAAKLLVLSLLLLPMASTR